MNISHAAHAAKTDRIKATVKRLATTGKQAKMFHGSSNSTRPPIDPDLAIIDVSDLNEILEINVEQGYVIAEPNVPLDALVRATSKRGMAPPMVAEFPGITVGGAAQGGSGESSSHKYGLFSDICMEYKVVLGNGEIIQASATDNRGLYEGLACAFGSLGVVTAIKIKLIPVTKYVRLNYQQTGSYDETIRVLKESVQAGAEFVDAIQFSKDSGVVVVGEYAPTRAGKVARFAHAWNEWFYLHVQKCLARGISEEYTPLRDYLFRYDRGGFWVAKYGFNDTHIAFNRLSRFLLAWMFKTRTLFKLLHSSGYSYVYLAQDICLPEETVGEFLRYNDATTQVYPLWICPLKPSTDPLAPTALDTKLVINVGIWGESKALHTDFRTLNRAIEREVASLGGRKVLYAHAYYTETEYWNIYNRPRYDTLRENYHATTLFPDVYHKTLTKPLTSTPSKRRALLGLLKTPYQRWH